jgi:glycosyltransferase involved in cell wall biosynthesis
VLQASASSPRTALTALLSVPRALEVVHEIEQCGSDVVHLFWARHAALVLLAMEMKRMHALRSAFAGAYDLVADDFLVEIALGSAQVAFSHAETNRGYVEARTDAGVPVHIIHRGIPLPPIAAEDVRDLHSWATASALVPEKNVEAVIRLFAAAQEIDSRLKLNIFGDGPDRPRLEAIAKELGCAHGVKFGGHIERSELFERMQRSAVFLLLSKKASERLPNVIKEALWAGCGVISSRTEGIEELIPDPGVGLIVDPDDTAGSLQAVRVLMQESGMQATHRRMRSRALIQQRFSSDGSMRRYLKTWRDGIVRNVPPQRPHERT